MMNGNLFTVLTAVFLFGGLGISLLKKRWEYTLIGVYLIFVLGIIDTAGSFGWGILLFVLMSVAFYGLYVLLKHLDDKVYEWRNRDR